MPFDEPRKSLEEKLVDKEIVSDSGLFKFKFCPTSPNKSGKVEITNLETNTTYDTRYSIDKEQNLRLNIDNLPFLNDLNRTNPNDIILVKPFNDFLDFLKQL